MHPLETLHLRSTPCLSEKFFVLPEYKGSVDAIEMRDGIFEQHEMTFLFAEPFSLLLFIADRPLQPAHIIVKAEATISVFYLIGAFEQ